MTLHEAIKQVIACDGMKAVTDVRIINILSDFQAFADCPSAKYVLRSMISDGYINRLLAIGAWNTQAQQLLNKFISDTGFQQQIADIVLQSVAYGLGWKKNIAVSVPSQPTNPQPNTNGNVSKPSPRASKEVWEDYILNIIEWVNSPSEIEKEYGVKLSLSISLEDDKKSFYVFTEMRGKKKKDFFFLNFTIYDENNKIRGRGPIISYGLDYKNYRTDEYYIDYPVHNIKKIILYAES